MSGILLMAGRLYGQGSGDAPLIVLALVIGSLLTFLVFWERVSKGLALTCKNQAEEVWQGELTPDYWSYTDKRGVKTSIPWSAITIALDIDKAWVISYSKQTLIVFREPLRKAGLEQEFIACVEKHGKKA